MILKDDGTGQVNIMRCQIHGTNNHSDNKSGLYCQHWSFVSVFVAQNTTSLTINARPNPDKPKIRNSKYETNPKF